MLWKKANWIEQKKPIESNKKANWIEQKSQLNRAKIKWCCEKKPIESYKKSQLNRAKRKIVVKSPKEILNLLFLPDIIKMQAVQK